MSKTANSPVRTRPAAQAGIFGPHFYYDLIRLARKGWPTFARVLYLGVLLVALLVMYRTQGAAVGAADRAEFARRAFEYAYTLIILQDLLVLVLVPVYVAGAIAEEKENQTLEALSLTHLTDTEFVLGKLGGRLMHVGAVVLSGFPILAFMHLWGNVEAEMLLYHEINTFLLLITAGSVCIWKSAQSESTFQAISGSYPLMAILAIVGMGFALLLPWMCGTYLFGTAGGGGLSARFLPLLPPLVIAHAIVIVVVLRQTIGHVEYLRREERRNPRKSTGALTLADEPRPMPKTGKHGETRSRIHRWAWPIVGDALWWKECLKDGTSWSLSGRWALLTLAVVPLIGAFFRFLALDERDRINALSLPISFTFTAYFVGLAAYALVVLFQLTMSVAGEREHDTLTFLLLIPEDRQAILTAKWFGPWWRNWPILAIAYLGVVLGLSSGVYGFRGALILLVLPWPTFLMLGGLALLLSVVCRRVMVANVVIVGFLGLLGILHAALGEQTRMIVAFFISVIGQQRFDEFAKEASWEDAVLLALGEQALFAAVGAVWLGLAFWIFGKRDYAGT